MSTTKIEVVLKWAGDVVDVRRLDVGSTIVIGTQPDADLCVPLKDMERMVLTLDERERTLELGAFTLETRPKQRSRFVAFAPVFDVLWANTATVTMFAMGAIVAIATLMPVDADSLDDDLLTNPQQLAAVILRTPPKVTTKMNVDAISASSSSAASETPKKTPAAQAPRQSNEEVVAKKMDALFGPNGGIATLFNTEGGGALNAALGDIKGSRTAARSGTGSLGLRGTGPGGPGATGTVGIGRIGTITAGTLDSGEALLSSRDDRDVAIFEPQPPTVMGSLDKEIIRRVVQEHAAQVRYCYEKSLQTRPGLEGKVTMKWVIGGDGRVTSATAADSSLKDADAESCLARKVLGWRFPAPKGGGVVVVNYPFVFKAR